MWGHPNKEKSLEDIKINEKMITQTENVKKMNSELTEFLKDETFSMI